MYDPGPWQSYPRPSAREIIQSSRQRKTLDSRSIAPLHIWAEVNHAPCRLRNLQFMLYFAAGTVIFSWIYQMITMSSSVLVLSNNVLFSSHVTCLLSTLFTLIWQTASVHAHLPKMAVFTLTSPSGPCSFLLYSGCMHCSQGMVKFTVWASESICGCVNKLT